MKKIKAIEKILAANRSEIAIRIFRAATELGLRTVAVYSAEDRPGPAPLQGRRSVSEVGAGKGPVQAYLDIPTGLLLWPSSTEPMPFTQATAFFRNPAFARACEGGHHAFVGPTPELLELLGDKTAARASGGVGGCARPCPARKMR